MRRRQAGLFFFRPPESQPNGVVTKAQRQIADVFSARSNRVEGGELFESQHSLMGLTDDRLFDVHRKDLENEEERHDDEDDGPDI